MSRPLLAWLALAAMLPAQDVDVAALVERLAGDDTRARSDAYQELMRRKPPEAIGLVARRLPTMPLDGQNLGLYLLQWFPLDDTRTALRSLLKEKAPLLRGAAAAMLWRGGERDALPVLTAALAAGDGRDAQFLLSRIYGIDDPAVRDAVRSRVLPGADDAAIDQALHHLLTTQKDLDQATIAAARAVLLADAQGATAVRARASAAAYLLARGHAGDADAVLAALAAGEAWLASLRRFLDNAPRLPEPVLDALAERLQKATSEYDVTATGQLLARHSESKAVAALRKLLDSGTEPVRKGALAALAQIPGALDARQLATMLASGDATVALVAAETLRRMDDPQGFDRVRQLATDGGTHRPEALRVLGGFRRRDAVPPLLAGLDDADLPVRTAAWSALQGLLPDLLPYRTLDLPSTGYAPNAQKAQRDAGVAALRAFWSRVAPQ